MCTGTNNTSAFVCLRANTRDGNGAHTRAGLLPAPHRLSTDCSCRTMAPVLNLSITVFLFTSPQRSLVSSDLPPVCIRKERLHCPARSWYLISLQALGANPTTSCLCSWCCGCGGVCTDMHISLHWLPSLTCSAQEGNRILAQAGSVVQLPTSAPTLFSRNYILHLYFKHISCQSRSPKTLVPRCSHSPHCGRAFSTGIWLMKH